MRSVTEVRAIPGRGLESDRYFSKTGTYSGMRERPAGHAHRDRSARGAPRDYRIALDAKESRRNIATRGVASIISSAGDFALARSRSAVCACASRVRTWSAWWGSPCARARSPRRAARRDPDRRDDTSRGRHRPDRGLARPFPHVAIRLPLQLPVPDRVALVVELLARTRAISAFTRGPLSRARAECTRRPSSTRRPPTCGSRADGAGACAPVPADGATRSRRCRGRCALRSGTPRPSGTGRRSP